MVEKAGFEMVRKIRFQQWAKAEGLRFLKNRINLASLLMILLTLSFTHLAYAVEIKGKVIEVNGARVKISYKSDYVPGKGGNVQIGIDIDGLFIPLEGDWKIMKASQGFAWAESKSSATVTPDVGNIAIFQADKTVARKVVPPAAKQVAGKADNVPVQRKDKPDSVKGIIWTTSELGDDYTWWAAYHRCEYLQLGGNTDWKLPGIGELETFYRSGEYERQGIKLKGCCAWSKDSHQEQKKRFLFGKKYTDYSWAFNFNTGERIDVEWTKTSKGEMERHPGIHVLCVRDESN